MTQNQNYEKHQKLIFKLAHKWNRPEIEFDELVSEGNMAFMVAQQKFDPGRGIKFSTYLYRVVENAMCDYVNGMKGPPDELTEFEPDRKASPERYAILKSWIASLSNDSQFILRTVWETPTEIVQWAQEELYNPQNNIKYISRYLRAKGWKWETIWASIREIREAVKKL
jgi:RNA polymerase sigma factor (sigma-70 family)